MTPDAAVRAVSPYVLEGASVKEAAVESNREETEDSFGNPGVVLVETYSAEALCEKGPEEIGAAYRELGFGELPGDSHREDDLSRFRLLKLDPSDPFLWENEVQVGVRGRDLTGMQRAVLEKKVASLRAELDGGTLRKKRRERALAMLEELESGLLTRIAIECRRRVFTAEPILDEGAVLGDVVPLRRMSQLVYDVVPVDPADREDEGTEPMYMTVLGVAEAQATFLFSGGIAGQRTVTDLEESFAHHAWFQNRQNVATDDAAPWVSRRVYRELGGEGRSEIVVRWGREDEPIGIRKTGEATRSVKVCGEPRDLPVLVAETDAEDRLEILADPTSPLVLLLEEKGADLLRTIGEIRHLDG